MPQPSGFPIEKANRLQEAATFLVAALIGVFAGYALYIQKAPPRLLESLSLRAPGFDTRRALKDVRELSTSCPARVTGSNGARCAADFIEKRFRDLGLPTRVQSFSMWLRGSRVTGRNVFSVARGNSPRSIIVIAHYDAPTTSRHAAADNATGVATLLELARIFAGGNRERTLIFVGSDAPDTTFMVKLIDVYPDGYEAILRAGAMMARYHAGMDRPRKLQADKVYRLEVDLRSTAYVFDKGHRLAVHVTSSMAEMRSSLWR